MDSKARRKANEEKDERLLKESGYTECEGYLTNFYLKVRNWKSLMDKLIRHRKAMESFKKLIWRKKECAKKIDTNQGQWDTS